MSRPRWAGAGPPAQAGVSATGLAVTLLGLVVAAILTVGVAWPWWSERRAAGRAAATDVPVGPATADATTPPTPPTPAVAGGPGVSGPLTPDRLLASATALPGVDGSGQPVSYEAENLTDGQDETAWRVPGSGVGVTLRAEWDAPVLLTSIGLLPGYAKVDPVSGAKRFWQNRRILAVRYRFDDGSAVDASFSQSPTLQPTAVEVTTRTVTVEITRTSPAPERDFTAISELSFEGAAA